MPEPPTVEPTLTATAATTPSIGEVSRACDRACCAASSLACAEASWASAAAIWLAEPLDPAAVTWAWAWVTTACARVTWPCRADVSIEASTSPLVTC